MRRFKETLRKACDRIYTELDGFGLCEKHYQKALVEELRDSFDNVEPEYILTCYYKTSKGRKIQICANRVDILVDDTIIIEIKRGDMGAKKLHSAKKQCRRYLKYLNQDECFLVIFKDSGVSIEYVYRDGD